MAHGRACPPGKCCAAGFATGLVDPLMPTDETTTATANSATVAARIRFGVSHVM
jgi:hypothetical protein